jgi:cytochrome c oxidase cbb3-type subunit II
MKNNPLFFVALFGALALSFGAMVLGSLRQLGQLDAYFDASEGAAFPTRTPGLAARGMLVYRDLGCATCHTQQVRRPGFGSDQARGWGERQSVARDYIYQSRVQLGQTRIGPDLTNFGERAAKAGTDKEKLYRDLSAGQGGMPAYSFLFESRRVVGQPARQALAVKSRPGYEIVPTRRAEALAAYLLSLRVDFTYPEAQPLTPATAPGGKP